MPSVAMMGLILIFVTTRPLINPIAPPTPTPIEARQPRRQLRRRHETGRHDAAEAQNGRQ